MYVTEHKWRCYLLILGLDGAVAVAALADLYRRMDAVIIGKAGLYDTRSDSGARSGARSVRAIALESPFQYLGGPRRGAPLHRL
jgi:hypothetical protein